MYDLYDRYDLYDLYDLYDRYDLYDLAHVAAWKPYNLRDLTTCFLGWICTKSTISLLVYIQILLKLSQPQVRICVMRSSSIRLVCDDICVPSLSRLATLVRAFNATNECI